MSASKRQQFNGILKYERSLAHRVFRKAMRLKPLGVWDVMIPFVFFLNVMKNKEVKELFIQNFMFTKKKALEAARDMHTKGVERNAALSHIEMGMQDILEKDKKGIYAIEIITAQLEEIDLLISHYIKLFGADKNDYAELVRSAYPGRQEYIAFLQKLASTEKAVAEVAMSTLGDQADTGALARIETAVARERSAEADRIFGAESDMKNADR